MRAKRDSQNKTFLAQYEDPSDLDILAKYRKVESATLNLNEGLQPKEKNTTRMTNTSNSRRSDSNEVRFTKKAKRNEVN